MQYLLMIICNHMRFSKYILVILLFLAAGGYAVLNHKYRAVEKQYMEQRSLQGTVDQTLDVPFDLPQYIASEVLKFFEQFRSTPPKEHPSEALLKSISQQKEELAGWLHIFRWSLFSMAGTLLCISWYSENNTVLLTWLCPFVFFALGISTPFLQITVESAKLPVPVLKEMDTIIFYYKAKSVAGVMHALITTSRAYEVILGILIGLFSVVAPLAKLCIVPLLPASGFKQKLQNILFRFAWVDVLAVSFIVSFLATDQLLSAHASNSFLFTGHSRLEDGILFFLLYLTFTTIGLQNKE